MDLSTMLSALRAERKDIEAAIHALRHGTAPKITAIRSEGDRIPFERSNQPTNAPAPVVEISSARKPGDGS
jgi:hypothetical protein